MAHNKYGVQGLQPHNKFANHRVGMQGGLIPEYTMHYEPPKQPIQSLKVEYKKWKLSMLAGAL